MVDPLRPRACRKLAGLLATEAIEEVIDGRVFIGACSFDFMP